MVSIFRKLLGLAFQADARSIRRYEEVKHRIARDLDFYASTAIGDEGAIAVAQREARQRANRESAYDLQLAAKNLPSWYRGWLHWQGEMPLEGPKSLVELSKATSRDDAEEHAASTKRCLRLPADDAAVVINGVR
jgi:hypothetical protein